MRARPATLAFWGGLVVALVIVAVVITGDRNREPLDPRSVAPDGARALVEVAERAGADVAIGIEIPGADIDVAIVLADTYGVAGRADVTAWVRRGGRLVVADPQSPLTPPPARTGATSVGAGACADPALAGIGRIVGLDGAYADSDPADVRCFGGGVVVEELGDGVIVSIGGPGPLLNESLAEADNAVLAVALLAPTRGTRVAFLEPRLVVAAGEDLEDLVGDPVWLLLIQLGAAFVVIALWKARRIGRPVAEPIPVEIAGSELTAARGRLLAGLRNPTAAATELRDTTRRDLARALGLPAGTDGDVVAAGVAARTGVATDVVRRLLEDRAVADDADLVAVATGLAELRELMAPARADGPARPGRSDRGDGAPPPMIATPIESTDGPPVAHPRSRP